MKRRRAARAVVASISAALLVAAWGTWPLAAHLRTAVYDPAHSAAALNWALRSDVYLTLWIPAWDVHALATAPWSLFDANIFHPAPRSLALTEHLLGILPIYAPLLVVSRDPVLAHQGTLLLTFACAFLAILALVHAWTGCWQGAALAAALYAFSNHRMYGLAGIQAEADFYLPLIPLCLERTLHTRSRLWGAALACVLLLQSLATMYLAYAAFMAAGLLLITGIALERGTHRGALHVVLWTTVAAMGVVAAATPYVKGSASGTIVQPTRDWLIFASAPLLETGANPAALLTLATLPFCRHSLRRGIGAHWIAALLVVSLFGHAVAMGPEVAIGSHRLIGPYTLLAHVVPGFAAVRNPGRFNALAAMGFASLGGMGFAGLIRRLGLCNSGFRATLSWLGAVAAIVFIIERAAPGPIPLMSIETRRTVAPVYRWLGSAPAGPLVEIPFWDFNLFPFKRVVEAQRVYRSVYHWHPLLNGYSGYTPPSYTAVSALVRALPDPRAVTLLARTTGLRYIVVHRLELSKAEHRRWRSGRGELRVVAALGPDVVLALRNPPPTDLLDRLVGSGASDTSLLGTPLKPIPPDGRRAQLTLASTPPRRVYRGLAFDVDVLVKNTSTSTWPALAPRKDHLVTFVYRWLDDSGRALTSDIIADRMPFDLAPGESVQVPVSVVASGFTGTCQLVIGLQQDAAWFGGDLPPVSLDVVPPG